MNPACAACKGACCSTITFPIHPDTPAPYVQWLEIRGKREGATVRFDAPCPQLFDGRCSIHTTKPQVCADYEVGSPQCVAAIRAKRGADAWRLVKLARDHQSNQPTKETNQP